VRELLGSLRVVGGHQAFPHADANRPADAAGPQHAQARRVRHEDAAEPMPLGQDDPGWPAEPACDRDRV
jgi:hypothetical protein